MAKNQAKGSARRRSVGNVVVKGDANAGRAVEPKRSKSTRREILFPTEPSTIGNEKIDRAIDFVISRRK
jgi:hypothetical protein